VFRRLDRALEISGPVGRFRQRVGHIGVVRVRHHRRLREAKRLVRIPAAGREEPRELVQGVAILRLAGHGGTEAGLGGGVLARGGRVVAVGTTTVRALESAVDEDGRVRAGHGETGLTITPGYRFRAVDALLTNFHLPRSSLLVLVSAFAGRCLVLDAYQHAVAARYRFYSYGDCMLIV